MVLTWREDFVNGLLTAAFRAGEQEIAEIEAAGQKGKEAARALKRKLTDRMTRFNNKAA